MPNGLRLDQDYPVITHSDELYARATGLVPAYTQTLAKGPGQYVKGVAPKFVERGKGGHVWDVDGNEYVDWNMGIGPLSLGYCDEVVDAVIRAQLAKGITFSQPSPLEVEVAELVRDVVPGAESVRYSKTGCDATTAAVRLARAYTGREKVLCCGYHGWHDWYIAVTDRNRGIPASTQDLSFTFNYNDLDGLAQSLDSDVACVILEPTVFEAPKPGFLEGVRELCTKHGALLIFDEMWTGFRLALGGAQEKYGVRSDLAVFSKAVANGMPLSLLTGRKDVMSLLDKDVFFFTTFGGEALSLAAAKATIGQLREKNVPAALARTGARLREGYLAAAKEAGCDFTNCFGMDARTIVTFDAKGGNPLELKSLMQQEMIKRGVLWGGFHNVAYAHTDADVEHTLAAYRQALPIVVRASREGKVREMLRGEPVEAVFRKTSNFNVKPKV
jgi:glutamate-1-semialdehyde aminotransferase